MPDEQHIERGEAFHRVSDVLSCKWTFAVMEAIDRGVQRPSEIQRELPGLTSKVLSERLRKLEGFGLIDRHAYAEVPPRVEYALTERGQRMAGLVGDVRRFVEEWSGSAESSA